VEAVGIVLDSPSSPPQLTDSYTLTILSKRGERGTRTYLARTWKNERAAGKPDRPPFTALGDLSAAGGADYIVSADVLNLSEVEGIPMIDADAIHFSHGNEKEAVTSPRIWSLGTVPPARAPVFTAATKKT